ncbi:hypothetical protein GCM10020254_13610 [Streptomyces goshikiensis]
MAAPLCRITFVAHSRTTQPSSAAACGGQRGAGLPYDGLDARRRQRAPGPVEFGGEAGLAVAGDGLPYLGQRLPAHRFDVADLAEGGVDVAGRDPAGHLRLHHDHREGVAQQVVQVAREAQPLLVDRRPGQLLPGVPQFTHGLGQGEDGRGDGARHQGPVHHPDRVPALVVPGHRRRRGGDREQHPPEGAAAEHGAGGESQQREEEQPVAPVGGGEGEGDEAERGQAPAGGDGFPGPAVEGPEHQADVEGVEGEQADDADPRVGGSLP